MIKLNRRPLVGPILAMVLAVSLLQWTPSQAEIASDTANGFIQIFDGKTLKGWKGDPTYWRVEDGHLIGEVTPKTLLKRNTFIIWQEAQPANFELILEYRISAMGNSGLNYRSTVKDDYPYGMRGYQLDIDGPNHYTGSNYEEGGRTTLAAQGQKTIIPPLQAPLGPNGLRPLISQNAWTLAIIAESLGDKTALATHIKDGEWNEIHLIATGNRLRHYVNGILMSEVADYDTINGGAAGYIGVQVHVGPPMKVEFRDIRLKRLNN